jgi:hypothetical protein
MVSKKVGLLAAALGAAGSLALVTPAVAAPANPSGTVAGVEAATAEQPLGLPAPGCVSGTVTGGGGRCTSSTTAPPRIG